MISENQSIEGSSLMKQAGDAKRNQLFVLVFFVLTIFCWCPLGYAFYGEATRILGVPYWAVIAVAVSGVLFVLEWIYLFYSGLAMNDDDVPEIIAQLSAVGADDAAKEDE